MTDSERFPCPDCDNTYVSRDSLRKHRKRMHDETLRTEDGEWKCSECGATFNRPQGLGAHRRTHGYQSTNPATVWSRERRRKQAEETGALSAGRQRPDLETDGLNFMLRHLFPDGIPTKKIPAVLRWIEQTKALLR